MTAQYHPHLADEGKHSSYPAKKWQHHSLNSGSQAPKTNKKQSHPPIVVWSSSLEYLENKTLDFHSQRMHCKYRGMILSECRNICSFHFYHLIFFSAVSQVSLAYSQNVLPFFWPVWYKPDQYSPISPPFEIWISQKFFIIPSRWSLECPLLSCFLRSA